MTPSNERRATRPACTSPFSMRQKPTPFPSHSFQALLYSYARSQGAPWTGLSRSQLGDERVHELRLSLKRLRAVVDLMTLAGYEVKKADAKLRVWNQELGALRDETIIQAWLTKQVESKSASGASKTARALKPKGPSATARDHQLTNGRALRIRANTVRVKELILKIGEKLARDQIGRGDGLHAEHALKESYKLTCKTWKHAMKTGKAKDLHHFRKRAKHLLYQIEACGPPGQGSLLAIGALRELARQLGKLNDLFIIGDHFEHEDGVLPDRRAALHQLRRDQKRARLAADKAATRFFVMKPREFIALVFHLDPPQDGRTEH